MLVYVFINLYYAMRVAFSIRQHKTRGSWLGNGTALLMLHTIIDFIDSNVLVGNI